MPTKNRVLMTDAMVDGLPVGAIVWDTRVPGLYIRRGKTRVTWTYLAERRRHGRRVTICKRLGHYPNMSVATARRFALVEAGKIAGGVTTAGKRVAVRFAEAWEEYAQHLLGLAKRRGKPPRWHKNATYWAKTLILPYWGKWPLAEMSASPAAVRDWHREITAKSGPVSANRSASILRATYKHAAKLNRDLPAALPTSAVIRNIESESQRGLAFKDFPAWRQAVMALPEPNRSFHMINLLVGARPGELARLTWNQVKPRDRVIIIAGSKIDDVTIPMSAAIAQALKSVRGHSSDGLVFGNCWRSRHYDQLPAKGMMLRHTYKTVATTIGIDEMIVEFLMGHRPMGVSRRYIVRAMLNSGEAMREAQRRISRRIVELMGDPSFYTLLDQLRAQWAERL